MRQCNASAAASAPGSRSLRVCAVHMRSPAARVDTGCTLRQRAMTTVVIAIRARGACIVGPVSTRAIVAYTSPDGTWKGVWNDLNSDPQQLGRVLLRRIASLKGDLDRFVTQFVDDCPEGWVALDKNERCADPIGVFGGKFDGIVATCDPAINALCFEAQYLYLMHRPKRRLFVFKIENREMRPFGMVTFDDTGKAKPNKLPAVEHEE